MKKAGKAPTVMKTGTTMLSTKWPRLQAATIPTVMPMTNERMNATPTRKIEYGSVRPTTSETCVG